MMSNEVYLVLFFVLLPMCSCATATIPIKRTTVRFKFDDWQLYNKYADAFQQPEVSIGTPPQPFTASIDLSWSDTFVPSVECLQDPATALYCREQNKYNSSLSTTYHPGKNVTQIMYGGLSTLGYLSQDVLRVGGLDILDQQFEEATFWRSMYWNAAPLDSALGLARLQSRTPASNASTKSALRSMLDQKMLSRPVFSLRLPRRDDESGELTLGYSPSEVLAQSTVTLPLIDATPPSDLSQLSYYISSGYTVELESVTIQSSPRNNLGSRKPSTYKAVFTNSFDYISLPETLLTEIQTNLHPNLGMGDLFADLDCSMRDDLPNIVFSFGKNTVIVLTPWDYLTEVRDIEKGMRCVLPFSCLPQADDEWVVLGSAFMVGVYSTFDLEKGEVSLSKLRE
ncbi:aspartic peptidase domain-containing protein [Phaeosphaeriaceae sp. PMI808]|nr:aspartic peptidase domain-containing protein [Phaeosphaeriaceae sp. PMI808]